MRSFNCGTGVQQGALLNNSIFHSFHTVDVFHHDINSVSSLEVQALNADKETLLGTTCRHWTMALPIWTLWGSYWRRERLIFSKLNRKKSQGLKSGELGWLVSFTTDSVSWNSWTSLHLWENGNTPLRSAACSLHFFNFFWKSFVSIERTCNFSRIGNYTSEFRRHMKLSHAFLLFSDWFLHSHCFYWRVIGALYISCK